MAPGERGGRGEGWRCFGCGATYTLGTPRCLLCAAALAAKVAELRSLRTGLPAHLTTFGPGPPRHTSEPYRLPTDDMPNVPSRVARLVALLRAGQVLTGDSVSALFGCSDRTGRRLLAEAHRALAASHSSNPDDSNPDQ